MNHVWKLTPVSMYDVRGLEQWLEHMAARGLFLKKYRPLVCTFEKGEAKQVRYRLEPYAFSLAADFPDGMVDLFQECSWRHVGTVNHEMLIFSSADPRAPEPHTDPDIRLEQWNKLYRKARKECVQMALIVLACLTICTTALFWGGTPLTKLLSSNIIVWEVLLFLFLRPLLNLAVQYSRVRELAAVIRELEGAPPKRFRLWFPSRQFFSWAGAAYVALLLFLLCFLNTIGRSMSLPGPVTEFPPLYVTDQETGITLGTDSGSWRGSLLCWNQRQSWDFEAIDERMLYLEVSWSDFPGWLSFLAVPAAKDLLTDSMKLDGQFPWLDKRAAAWTIRDYPDAGADWLSVADSENGVYHTAAAALEDKVVVVRYRGSGDLTGCLDEIVDMVR